jgi:hypothetical protein
MSLIVDSRETRPVRALVNGRRITVRFLQKTVIRCTVLHRLVHLFIYTPDNHPLADKNRIAVRYPFGTPDGGTLQRATSVYTSVLTTPVFTQFFFNFQIKIKL